VTEKLIAVTRTSSRGSSLRITLPKEIAEILKVGEKDHIGFYESNGNIVIRKIE
jgi:bifunctional DNA-binding transcriptional regulator/antitoxin component of YhaV-PrlF toxin-antitoxin module